MSHVQSKCTLREAVAIASALPEVKMPLMRSAAALTRFVNMDYSVPSSLFIRQVVDALSLHFIRVQTRTRLRPAAWVTRRCSPCGGTSCSCFASSK